VADHFVVHDGVAYTLLAVACFWSIAAVTDWITVAGVDRAVATSPAVVTGTFSMVITMSMGDAKVAVVLSKSVTALILMTNWVTSASEGLTVVTAPELVANTSHGGIPAGVVGTVVAVTGIWSVTSATLCVAWSLII
jgi:hypothetical protein